MIRPRRNWLLVKAAEKKEVKLSSGFVLPEGWDVAPESIQGEVVATGPDVTDIAVGQVILAPQFAPTQARELPSDKTFIVDADDVLAVIEPDTAAK